MSPPSYIQAYPPLYLEHPGFGFIRFSQINLLFMYVFFQFRQSRGSRECEMVRDPGFGTPNSGWGYCRMSWLSVALLLKAICSSERIVNS